MIAYKGFNSSLCCTMGHGVFQYKVGETYREEKAQCINTGFHCVEEPIEVLWWYGSPGNRYCIVDAGGDIHEDGDERIACTEMTIRKEISLEELGILECLWITEHPERKCSKLVERDSGWAAKGRIVVVRGKDPRAAGEEGATIFLLKEEKGGTIQECGVFRIDGKQYKPRVYYNVKGRKVK